MIGISSSSSNCKRTALFMVIALLLSAERLASWKMRRKHIRWSMSILSHCIQWFLNQSTMALCWSLFLTDVLKNTLTSTRYCLIWQYVCCLCEKNSSSQHVGPTNTGYSNNVSCWVFLWAWWSLIDWVYLLVEQVYDSLFLLFFARSCLQLLSSNLCDSSFLISCLLTVSFYFLFPGSREVQVVRVPTGGAQSTRTVSGQ